MLSEVVTLISEEQLKARTQQIALELSKKFAGQKVCFVGILKGSFMFYSDLIRSIDLDMTCDFMGLSSYKGMVNSSGEVKVTLDLNTPIKDRHVVLVEDIVDTGLTMNYLKNTVLSRKPASLTTVSLLLKPKALKEPCTVDYVGFEIGNDFVVGYGLDYQEMYRNLPFIGVLKSLN